MAKKGNLNSGGNGSGSTRPPEKTEGWAAVKRGFSQEKPVMEKKATPRMEKKATPLDNAKKNSKGGSSKNVAKRKDDTPKDSGLRQNRNTKARNTSESIANRMSSMAKSQKSYDKQLADNVRNHKSAFPYQYDKDTGEASGF